MHGVCCLRPGLPIHLRIGVGCRCSLLPWDSILLLLLLLWGVRALGIISSLCSIALVGIGGGLRWVPILLLILLRVGILGTVLLVLWMRVVVLLAVLVCVVWTAAVYCLMVNSRAPRRGASVCLGSWNGTILLILSSHKVWRRSPRAGCAGILHWQTLFAQVCVRGGAPLLTLLHARSGSNVSRDL